jgi:hypothetical protein
MRFALPAIVVIVLAGLASAGDESLKGYWKVSIFKNNQAIPLWLLQLDSKDGKPTANFTRLRGGPKVKSSEMKFVGDTFTIKIRASVNLGAGETRDLDFDYEGKLPRPGAKKILGSIDLAGEVVPAVLDATSAKNVYEIERDVLLRTPTDPRAQSAILDVIDLADEHKVTPRDLQDLITASRKAAELYGPRQQLVHDLRLLDALQPQKTYETVAVDIARKIAAEFDPRASLDVQMQVLATMQSQKIYVPFALEIARKMVAKLDPKSPLDEQLVVMTTVASVLRKGDQIKEAIALENRVGALEDNAYNEYVKTSLNYKTEKFAGRKVKSDRAVLVELFTGAACPPCVAADLAFDGVEKTYAPGEAVLLQYHVHIPRPEPLSNEDGLDRFKYYAAMSARIRGAPAIVFNGKPDAPGGGPRDAAGDKYKDYCEVINKLIEAPAALKLSATAERKDSKIAIQASVQDLQKPGDTIILRLALVEDWVRFKGPNGMAYHHRVVRSMPLGSKGVPLKAKSTEQKATVNLDDLRKNLNKFLDEDYPEGSRPMLLRHLSVVAFVQDDDTGEVLQAVNIPVKGRGE